MRSLTSPCTTAVNAAPMTIPTARPTTLPRNMKSLKPFNIEYFATLGLMRLCRHLSTPFVAYTGAIEEHRDQQQRENDGKRESEHDREGERAPHLSLIHISEP